ncbi:thioredoxin domain-containing protein [Pyrobaculum sp.]|uniref:thioredoxin domain-containing protein n=1 Tax=Pyrobaculum sp. TaxID=2004705 RepID=UPI003172FAC9
MDREACLRRSTSPFVLDGLRSKVQWWAWCEEAFQKAKAEDKPILVDVGAVWCHWCHVIDETTYNDDEIADIINKHFVPIKVDRDERPDVDRRLQEYAVLVSGQSGWPLTVFMTPEGEVIWAATYLPPRDYGGLPGMAKVLRAVLEAYRTKKGDIKKMAEDLSKEIAAWHNPSEAELDRSVQLDILASLAASFDEEYGGFGTAPKFPPITQLDLLLLRHFYDGKSVYGKMAQATLRAMARGGVYDQVGGGFFRYSTDRLWLIPHYEKLLVDNAELLSLYARAYAHFGDQLYRKTAVGIIKWLDEFMRDPSGGYYASQDADVDGEEGAYYRWTEDELKEALGDLFPKAAEMFGLYEFKWPEGRATLSIVRIVPEADLVLERLAEARKARKPPRVDTTIYAGWSCAMAKAELEASRLAGIGDKEFALKTLDKIRREAWDGSRLARGLRGGGPVGEGVLEDYAYCALAALEAYSHTGRYLDWGVEVAGAMVDRFLDQGGFRDVERPDPVLKTPHYPVADTPNYSGNALAILACDLLHYATGIRKFRDAAERALKALAGKLARLGPSAAGLAIALDAHLAEPPRTVVVGSAEELLRAALAAYRPLHVVMPVASGWDYPEPSIKAMLAGPKPAAYVCAWGACSMPISDPGRLGEAVRKFRREAYGLE